MNFFVLHKPCEKNICHYIELSNAAFENKNFTPPFEPNSPDFENNSLIIEKIDTPEKISIKVISVGKYVHLNSEAFAGDYIPYNTDHKLFTYHNLETIKKGTYSKSEGSDKLSLIFDKKSIQVTLEGQFKKNDKYTLVSSSEKGSIVRLGKAFHSLVMKEESGILSVRIDFGHPTQEAAQKALDENDSNGLTVDVPYLQNK